MFYIQKSNKDGRDKTCKCCRAELRMVRYFKEQGKDKKEEDRKRDELRLKEKLRVLKINLYKKRRKTHTQCSICRKWALGGDEPNRCKPCYNKYVKDRKKDPLIKLADSLRCRMYLAFKAKSWNKEGSQKLLGCTFKVAHKHLERQFIKGMSWENYGEWHIDHIIPLSSAETEEELKELCHYTNLQPLWASENISKGNKITEHQIKLRI